MPTCRMNRWRRAIATATALCAVPLLTVPAAALPAGGTVTGGGVTIGQPSGGKLVVDQTTSRGAIDWHSFSIGRNESVRFNQPDAASISFNRVTGPDPSKIMGNLSSNGQVWLMNPNGVLFGATARVDTSGLVASTASMTPASFMAGSRDFSLSGRADATIVNEGRISVRDGGLAAFVAPGVRNSGVIEARVGRVALASGDRYTLDLYGDGLVKLAVDDRIASGLVGVDGKRMTARVENSGTIKADGGSVLLTTAAASQVVDSLINVSGTIQARAATLEGGRIVLRGDGGTVTVAGTLDATGAGDGRTGGTVQVSAARIVLDETARVDVSGSAGGGSALIGGDVKGSGALPTAKRTVVATGATIRADAGKKGKGGKVIVWSDDDTRFGGTISANGGKAGGDGGFAEVSGKQLQYAGAVSLAAPAGKVGTLLLDPTDIRITGNPADAGGPGDGDPVRVRASNADRDPVAGETRLYASDLQGKNVILAADRDVSIDAPIGTGDLSITAGNDINVNAEVASAALALRAGNDISLNAPVRATGPATLTAGNQISLAAPMTVTGRTVFSARDVRIDANLDVTQGIGTALAIDAGGLITGDGIVHVRGDTTLTAGRISLTGGTESGGQGNLFEGVLNLNSLARTLVWSATDTVLGKVDVGGDLVLGQTAGAITQIQPDGQPGIVVGGLLDIDALASTGGVKLTARNVVDNLSVRTGGNLAFTSRRALELGTLDVRGDARLSGRGNQFTFGISQSLAGRVDIAGTTTFIGRFASTRLLNEGNSFGGVVTLAPAVPALLHAAGDLSLTGRTFALMASAGGALTLTDIATSAITIASGGNMTLTGVTADTLTATAGGTLTFAGVDVGTLAAQAGNVVQSEALIVRDGATITAAGGVTLADADNRFGSANDDTLSMTAAGVTLGGTVTGSVEIGPQPGTVGAVVLADLSIEADMSAPRAERTGNLTIRAGSVDQTGPLAVSGKTAISAGSARLTDMDNSFGGEITLTATGPVALPPISLPSGVFAIASRRNLTFATVSATRLTLTGNSGRTVTFRGPIDMPKGIVEIAGFDGISLNGGAIGQAVGGVLASQEDDGGALLIGGQRFTGAFPFKTNPLAELTSAAGLLAAFAATSNDDFVRRLGKGESSQTPAENAIEYRPEYEGYATNPFTPRYDLLGFDRGDPRAASFARNTPYVLDGFWEGLLR